MLASLAWLRSLCPVDADAAAVAEALTTHGLTVDSLRAAGRDHAIEIDVPANRPDCLGHLGLARELSAAFGVPLREDLYAPHVGAGELADHVRVRIDEPTLCSRFTASLVRDVQVGPSPAWVLERLEVCGLRSINNVVDASNLVMLETANPIHFYDYPLVADATLRVKLADDGERLTTLDGVERTLDAEALVIADGRRAVGLAGIIGGAESEIGESTREVLIEAAWFQPGSVRRTARRLGVGTDASHRFERGADPQGVLAAQALAVRLLVELAGGTPVPGLLDEYPAPAEVRTLILRLSQIDRLLGYRPPEAQVRDALAALQLSPKKVNDDRYEVTVPSWRVDLEREADLVEEVARTVGYDEIPVRLDSPAPTGPSEGPESTLEFRSRDLLAHNGFHEAYGYAMIGPDADARFVGDGAPAPLRIDNPIAESLAFLRRSVLPGLLRAVDRNQRRGVRDVRLFEIGRVFIERDRGALPFEPLRAGLAWSGAGEPRHWGRDDRDVDLFDMMGAVEHLLRGLRPTLPFERASFSLSGLHPGASVAWQAEGPGLLAWAGRLHPELQEDLAHPVFLGEIDLETLAKAPSRVAQYGSIPRLTEVTRDLSLVLGPQIAYRQLEEVLLEVPPPAAVVLDAVDRYEGAPLAEGEVSLTIRVTLYPDERTLTEPEIEGYRTALVQALDQRLGVQIR